MPDERRAIELKSEIKTRQFFGERICALSKLGYTLRPGMKDARIDEIRPPRPKAVLPDWMRLGGQLQRPTTGSVI
jgi:hypothetical protein